jgi:DNA invertase Pin-like site-specific DNA recombinase
MQKQDAMKRDAIYCRDSSNEQERGTALDLQIERCKRLVKGEPVVYCDRGTASRAWASRTELRHLLDDAHAGLIRRLIINGFDRLARDKAEAASIAAELKNLDIEVIIATGDMDVIRK